MRNINGCYHYHIRAAINQNSFWLMTDHLQCFLQKWHIFHFSSGFYSKCGCYNQFWLKKRKYIIYTYIHMYECTYTYKHTYTYIYIQTQIILSTKIIPPSPQAKNPLSIEESQDLSPIITCTNACLNRKMMCMYLQQGKRMTCFHVQNYKLFQVLDSSPCGINMFLNLN